MATGQEKLTEELQNRPMSGGSVTVGGTKYAVGLLWAPLQNQDDPIPEIREAMEAEPAADLYCLRNSAAPQYGLGKTIFGHHSGEPALAASVATALSGKNSACCVFKIDDGWWFVAIRNDLILAEEDVLFHAGGGRECIPGSVDPDARGRADHGRKSTGGACMGICPAVHQHLLHVRWYLYRRYRSEQCRNDDQAICAGSVCILWTAA